jgi:uncharacterized protein (TIGR02246 family)
MKRIATLTGSAVIALMAIACNQPADTHDADVKALKNLEIRWNQDFAAKDADMIASYYVDDAVLMGPGAVPSIGKDAILATAKQMVADPALSLKFQAAKVVVSKSGDLAYTQGSYTMTMTNPMTHKPMDDRGSYVTVYRKGTDGKWKAVSDIATSEVPPAPAAPAVARRHAPKPPMPKKHPRKKR